MRGQFACLALTLLREAEDAKQHTEASMIDNFLGLVAYWRGVFVEALRPP
jgi:hypothetical protein